MEKPENYLTLSEAIAMIENGEEDALKKVPLAQIIDAATEYREEIRQLDKEVKLKKETFKVFESMILAAMKAAGTEESPLMQAGGLQSTATLSEDEVPTVADWDKLNEYIKDNDAFHLYQKRVAAKAWKEEKAITGDLPGVESFKVLKVSLRKR